MASEQTSVLPLLLLVVGSGLLKGNISAQVGALYPRNEEALRTRGFAVFSIAPGRSLSRPLAARPLSSGVVNSGVGRT